MRDKSTENSTGFSLGGSAQVNWGDGSGAWQGDFNNTDLGLGIVSGGTFSSPDRLWEGTTLGVSAGVPAAVSTSTTTFLPPVFGHDGL